MATNESVTLRLKETAAYLNVSQRFIRRLVKTGSIPHLRLGDGKRQVLLFPRGALERWLAERTVGGSSAAAC